jgi:hypothetical protein
VADLQIGQSACWGLCRDPFSLGAVGSIELCWVSVKGCHKQGPPIGCVLVVYVDWHEKRTCRVYQIFPYRVYLDLNRRDSRI